MQQRGLRGWVLLFGSEDSLACCTTVARGDDQAAKGMARVELSSRRRGAVTRGAADLVSHLALEPMDLRHIVVLAAMGDHP